MLTVKESRRCWRNLTETLSNYIGHCRRWYARPILNTYRFLPEESPVGRCLRCQTFRRGGTTVAAGASQRNTFRGTPSVSALFRCRSPIPVFSTETWPIPTSEESGDHSCETTRHFEFCDCGGASVFTLDYTAILQDVSCQPHHLKPDFALSDILPEG